MIWLLKLYPPRWRRRYGAELADFVAAQRFSIRGALDLLAGAVDAWLNPQLTPLASEMTGGVSMVARLMHLECAGYATHITGSDRRRNAAINIGGTLALALLWLALVWLSKSRGFSGQAYLLAAAPMTYLLPYLIGLRHTTLKGRSSLAQAIVIGSLSATMLGILMLATWIGTKL